MLLSFGPIPTAVIVLSASLAIASAVAHATARVTAHATVRPFLTFLWAFLDMLLLGLIAARLAFVLQYLPQYQADPWSIIRPGDGGYSIWAGVIAALAVGASKARRCKSLRRPLVWGSLAGLAAWGLLSGSLALMQRSHIELPDLRLNVLDGEPIQLSALTGRPTVVNLWASWCPPCRREMPLLAETQAMNTDIHFVFVNQGEGAEDIRRYLKDESLQLANVVVDPFSAVARALNARGLPTTLFFDRSGRLVDTHMGELTRASLIHKLKRVDENTDPR